MKEAKIIKAEDYLDVLKDKAKETDILAKENLELKRRLNDIDKFIKSIDIDKMPDNVKVILDSIMLIKNGTIKVVDGEDDE